MRLAVTRRFGSFDDRAKYGFRIIAEQLGRRGLPLKVATCVTPCGMLDTFGIVQPNDIDVVLDASGFAFSDQWGPNQGKRLLARMQARDRRRADLVLLPQAFGPFRQPAVARVTKDLIERACLTFARDEQSMAYLSELTDPRSAKIFESPDFTLGVSSRPDEELMLPASFAAIVPNIHMLGKTGQGAAYLRFLQETLHWLKRHGLDPIVVLHDASTDRRVLDDLEHAEVPTVEHGDPRVLKWVLGRAALVIGSRFHSLVSALSQGVPCIGAGWSHKYAELFSAFDCSDLMIRDVSNRTETSEAFLRVAVAEHRDRYRAKIHAAATRLKMRNLEMWQKVEDVIRARC